MKKNIYLFLFACICVLILAALPRSIEFLNRNYLFGFDQGKHWLAAKSIVVDHKFPLIGDEVGGAQGGFFQGSGWYYLLAIAFILFGGDPYGGIVLIFMLSVGLIAMFMALFKSYLGKKEIVTAGMLLAIAPILISNARFVWPPFVIPFLTVLYLFFVYNVLLKKYVHIIPVFFTIGLMAHFEIATAGTLFISTMILYVCYIVYEKIPVKYLFFGLVGFILPLFPLLIFDIRHDFLNTKGIIEMFTGSKTGPITTEAYIKIVANHWMIFYDEFFRAFQMLFLPKIVISGLLIAGTLSLLLDKRVPFLKKKFVAFLFISPISLFLVFLLFKSNVWAWWIPELTVIYIVLMAMVLVYGWQKGLIMRGLILVITGLMMFSYIKTTYSFLSKELFDYGGVHKIKGKTDALDIIYRDAKNTQFGLLIFTPPIYTYPYDYLLWWYGKNRYGYIPPYEKKNIFYLLIEPDEGQPWRHKGWIETVIKDGAILDSWVLPSGFIIEKRML